MDNQEELSLKIEVIDQVLFPRKYIATICGYISIAKDLKTILDLHKYKWNPETAKKWTIEAVNGLNDRFYIIASHFENTDTVSINFADKLDTRAKVYSTNKSFELQEELREEGRKQALLAQEIFEQRQKIIQREALEKQLEARRKAHEEVTIHDIIHKFYN